MLLNLNLNLKLKSSLKLLMNKTFVHIEELLLSGKSILLFDGVCNLCNGFVQFVLERDPTGKFVFASLQSEIGQSLLEQYKLSKALRTVVLIDKDKSYTQADVPLLVAQRLGGWLKIFYIGWFIPRGIRNSLYNAVAANRYYIFGKKEQCILPKPAWRHRFL